MFGEFAFAAGYFAEGPGQETPPPPTAGVLQDKFTLGTKESVTVTIQPTLGGRWGW